MKRAGRSGGGGNEESGEKVGEGGMKRAGRSGGGE